MLMNRSAILTNFHSTYLYIMLLKIFLCLLQGMETLKVNLLEGALITKTMELFHRFHLFASFRFVRYV